MSEPAAGSPKLLVLDTATRHEAVAVVDAAGVLGSLQIEKPRGKREPGPGPLTVQGHIQQHHFRRIPYPGHLNTTRARSRST